MSCSRGPLGQLYSSRVWEMDEAASSGTDTVQMTALLTVMAEDTSAEHWAAIGEQTQGWMKVHA